MSARGRPVGKDSISDQHGPGRSRKGFLALVSKARGGVCRGLVAGAGRMFVDGGTMDEVFTPAKRGA